MSVLSRVAKMLNGDKMRVLPVLRYERKDVEAMERAEERRREFEHKSEFQETMNKMKIDKIQYKEAEVKAGLADTKVRLTDHEYLAKKFEALLGK